MEEIPHGVTNVDLYALLSNFGTVLGIELRYYDTEKEQVRSVRVTFFTDEEAQYVLQAINASRLSENAILASSMPEPIPQEPILPPQEEVTKEVEETSEIADSANQPSNEVPRKRKQAGKTSGATSTAIAVENDEQEK